MDAFIDAGEANRRILTGELKDEWIHIMSGYEDLRVKLILDLAPIEIKPTGDLCRHPCIICGARERADSPSWGFIDDRLICDSCFKRHEPELYEKTMQSNKEWWMKEHPEDYNPDGSYKNEVSAGVDTGDGLPF